MTWQATGPRAADAFISIDELPRSDQGGIDWAQVAPEVREKFLGCHTRHWLEPILVGGTEEKQYKGRVQA